MSEMYWTRTKPDRPGLWLARVATGRQAVACRVESVRQELKTVGGFDRFQWWCFIPEPSEPPSHPDVRLLRYYAQRQRSPNVNVEPTQAEWDALADRLQAALTEKP